MIFFIADLHLQTKKSLTYTNFLHFLKNDARNADMLYILGDLFEIWIGDDDLNPLHYEVATAIKKLVDSGTSCFFVHGNRDFLIGKQFALKSGMILLPKEKILNFYNRKILVMHGDTLYTNNIIYRIFRTIVHMPFVQKLFLILPLRTRSYFATGIRFISKIITSSKSSSIMDDYSLQLVIKLMEKYKVQWLIHGHNHCPCIHKFTTANGKLMFRIVLGEWRKDMCSILKLTAKNIELINF